MGSWGTGIFENDTAGDFVYELEGDDQEFIEAIEGAIEISVDPDEGLDADDGTNALAAAACVAVSLGHTVPDMDPEVAIRCHSVPGLSDLAERAASAARLVRADASELRELWEETDDFAEWLAVIDTLLSVLDPS